jgi:hypothetical protein
MNESNATNITAAIPDFVLFRTNDDANADAYETSSVSEPSVVVLPVVVVLPRVVIRRRIFALLYNTRSTALYNML